MGNVCRSDNPNDELGRLASVFNATLGRLESAFGQMQRFTSDVSHELRTPLTAIRSVGEVGLRERRDERAYREIIGSMLEEADRLSCLVDRLLTLSRVDSGQAKLSFEVIDVGDLAADVAAQLGVLAEEKHQIIEIASVGSPQCLGDRVLLRQALTNIVDNAIKYSPDGERIDIRVSGSTTSSIVDVSDSGPGIAPSREGRIFDRFYRAGGADSLPGTGLGLAIAKWAVEAIGGSLSLQKTPGGGCTFRITLPRRPWHDRTRVTCARASHAASTVRARQQARFLTVRSVRLRRLFADSLDSLPATCYFSRSNARKIT